MRCDTGNVFVSRVELLTASCCIACQYTEKARTVCQRKREKTLTLTNFLINSFISAILFSSTADPFCDMGKKAWNCASIPLSR